MTIFKPTLTPRWLDFPVYYTAGQKALQHLTVYDVVGHYQFKYSPFSALLFGWLTSAVSMEMASAIFQKVCALGIALFTWKSAKRLGGSPWPLFVMSIAFFGNAVRLELELGQVNVFPMLLCFFAVFSKRHLWLRALALSLAIQIKLYCVLFIPLFFFLKQFRFLAWMLVGSVLMTFIIPMGFHGVDFSWSETMLWLTSLTQSSSDLLSMNQNIGLVGFLSRAGVPQAAVLLGLLVACIGWLLLLRRSVLVSIDQSYLWVLFGIVILNPLVWPYWCWFLIPVAQFIQAVAKHFSGIQKAVIFLPMIFFNMVHAQWAWSYGMGLALIIFLYLFHVARRTRKAIHLT